MINKEIIEEYNIVKNNVGLFDFSFEGKIKVTGEGSIDFLNGIVSNDVKNLKVNFGIYAAFLDKFGRILSDCYIYKFKDFLLILLPFSQKNKIFKKLKEEAPLANSKVEDITLKYALLNLQGPKSNSILKKLFNDDISIEKLKLLNKKIKNIEVNIINSKRSNEDCFDLFFEGNNYNEILNLIMNEGKKYNIKKAGNEVYEILRIEAGIPLFGADFDEKTILNEVGEKAISYDKGCFVGQEVIARIKNVGKGITAKKLIKFEIDTDKVLEKNTSIFRDKEKIGYISSSAYSPGLKKVLALGYLERPYYNEVKEVEIGENKIKAKVIKLEN